MSDDDAQLPGEGSCTFCLTTNCRIDHQHKIIIEAGVALDSDLIAEAFAAAMRVAQSKLGPMTQTQALGFVARMCGLGLRFAVDAHSSRLIKRDSAKTDARLMNFDMGAVLALSNWTSRCGALMAVAGFAEISCEHGFDSACETFPDLKDRPHLNLS